MSLATRCTACGTVFRVVQDQLKVSEGWVRCGRCNEVFNALEGLFDLDRETPSDWSPFAPPKLVPKTSADDSYDADEPISSQSFYSDEAPEAAEDPTLVDKIDAQLLGPRRHESRTTPAARVSQRDRLDFPDAQFDPDVLDDEGVSQPQVLAEPLWSDDSTPELPAPPVAPEFIREAQRQERWNRPMMRAALGVGAGLLLLILALQYVHQFRDTIAARWPAAKPALMAWCGMASCTIDAPRRIDDVSVESTALTRAPEPDSFKLSVALRNRGTMAVALPSVDLTLTDPTGQVVAKRVLNPRDFRATSTLLSPGGESALQLVLTAGTPRVAGYTVEIFYP
jgi:predicted Zn finger-like uncharacterized protein